MASPHVPGLAALLMQQGITSPAAIEDALEAVRRSISARRAATITSATAWSTCATRMFGIGAGAMRTAAARACAPVLPLRPPGRCRARSISAIPRAVPAVTLRGFVDVQSAAVRGERDVRDRLRRGRGAVPGRRRAGRRLGRTDLRRGRAVADCPREQGASASACSSAAGPFTRWAFRCGDDHAAGSGRRVPIAALAPRDSLRRRGHRVVCLQGRVRLRGCRRRTSTSPGAGSSSRPALKSAATAGWASRPVSSKTRVTGISGRRIVAALHVGDLEGEARRVGSRRVGTAVQVRSSAADRGGPA